MSQQSASLGGQDQPVPQSGVTDEASSSESSQALDPEVTKLALQAPEDDSPEGAVLVLRSDPDPTEKGQAWLAQLHERASSWIDVLLKGGYGCLLLGILVGQLFATNLVFYLHGTGALKYDAPTLQIFVGATMAEIAALVWVIVSHLFPRRAGDGPKDRKDRSM